MVATHIRVSVYKVYGLPWRVIGDSCGCYFSISLGGLSSKTQPISRLSPNDSLEWMDEHHTFPIPSDINSASIVLAGFSHNLIPFPVKEDEFLASISIPLADINIQQAAIPKLYHSNVAVNSTIKMKLQVAISFIDLTGRSGPVGAPREPDALNIAINNMNASNDNTATVEPPGHLDMSNNPHMEVSEMLIGSTQQRHLHADFIAAMDQSSLPFSPRVSSSPGEAAFGVAVANSDDTTLVMDDQEQQVQHGIQYGDLSIAIGGEDSMIANNDHRVEPPGHLDISNNNPHLEVSEMLIGSTQQRHLHADFIAAMDQSNLPFSPRVSSSPGEAAFGVAVANSDDTTLVLEEQEIQHGIQYRDLPIVIGGLDRGDTDDTYLAADPVMISFRLIEFSP